MPFVGGGCGQAGRFRGARGEDGADKRARASAAGHGGAWAVAWRGCWAERPRRAARPVIAREKARGPKTRKGGDDHFSFLFSKQFFPKSIFK